MGRMTPAPTSGGTSTGADRHLRFNEPVWFVWEGKRRAGRVMHAQRRPEGGYTEPHVSVMPDPRRGNEPGYSVPLSAVARRGSKGYSIPWAPASLSGYICLRCGREFNPHKLTWWGYLECYDHQRAANLARGHALRHVAACGKPDPSLRRVTEYGYTVAYETRDGRFRVENGLAGMEGGARTPWTIRPLTNEARVWLHAAGGQPHGRKRDAAAWLKGSVYSYADCTVEIEGDGSVTVNGEHYQVAKVSAA